MMLIESTILNRGLLKYVFIMDYNAHMNKDLTYGRRSRGPGGIHPPDFDRNRDKNPLLQKSPQRILDLSTVLFLR